MNTKTITDPKKIATAVLLCSVLPWAHAASYRIDVITKENPIVVSAKKIVKDTTFEVLAGNQYLNNNGQVVGTRRENYQNKVFNYGKRAFIWQRPNVLRTLATLGTDSAGYGESIPNGLNNKGQVAGSSRYFDRSGTDQGLRAVYWNSGVIIDLGKEAEKSGFVTSTGAAINANGQVAGNGLLYEKGVDKGRHLLLWTQGKAKNLGASSATVTGMNAVGHVIATDSDAEEAFLWTNSLHKLNALGNDPSGYNANYALAINNKDQVVGKSATDTGMFSVLWQNGLIQDLGTLSSDPNVQNGSAIAINEQGQVIGYSAVPTGQHAYLWANGQMTDIGALGLSYIDDTGEYDSSYPNALNNNGQVVGFSSYSEGKVPKGNHAFIYQNKILTDLNNLLPLGSGWLLENALAINDKGQVTVYGTYTKGTQSYKGYALLTPKLN
jgi:probable HAF family extracellular repeat protein